MEKTLFGIQREGIKPYSKRKGYKKPVLQIKDGIIIGRFDSISEAGRETNIRSNKISMVCNGSAKTCSGFVWRYAEHDLPIEDLSKNREKMLERARIFAKRHYEKKKLERSNSPHRVDFSMVFPTKKDAESFIKSNNLVGSKIIKTRNRYKK